MSGTSHAGSYRALLSDAVVARTFVLALTGRLGYAVLPLTFLFTVRQSTGSFAVAASAMAAFGATTVVMPFKARLADRHGQRRVLPVVAGVFVLVLTAAAALATHSTAASVWVTVSVTLGVFAPSLGPCMRAQWRRFVPEGHARMTAYSLDAVCEETLYLVGPVVAAAVLARGPAWHGLVVVAGLVTVGTIGLAASPAARGHEWPAGDHAGPAADADGRSPLRISRVRFLLVVMSLFGVVIGMLYAGVAARADAAGRPAYAGYVEIAVAAASVVGGLAWGARTHRRAWPTHLAGTLGLLAAAMGAAAATSSWWLLGAALVGAGAAMAPTYTVAFVAADTESPAAVRTEASTWVSTVTNLGASAGTALTGLIVEVYGHSAPLAAAAGIALVGCTLSRRLGR